MQSILAYAPDNGSKFVGRDTAQPFRAAGRAVIEGRLTAIHRAELLRQSAE